MASQREIDRPLLMQGWIQTDNAILFWNQKTNDMSSEIDKQLIGLAFLLIPLSGSVVLTDIYLNPVIQYSLILAFISFGTSIGCGFRQLSVNSQFFKNYMKDNVILSNTIKNSFLKNPLSIKEVYKKYKLDKKKEIKKNKLKTLDEESNKVAGTIQKVFLSIGVGFLVIVVIGIMFFGKKPQYYGTIRLDDHTYKIQIQENN